MPAQERTESATPRRREEVRRRGQTARSAEVGSVAALLAGFLFLRYWGANVVTSLIDMMRASLQNLTQPDLTVDTVMRAFGTFALVLAMMIAPIFLLMMGVGVAANLLQVGFLLTLQPLQPDFARLNPFEGFKRLFSKRSLVELGKAIAKLSIVGFVVYSV